MNKEALLKLKEEIDRKRKEKYYFYDDCIDGPITLFDLEKSINTEGAIKYIEEYFAKLVLEYSAKGIVYDNISLVPYYSLVIHEEFCDEDGLKEGKEVYPLNDIIKLSIVDFSVNDGDESIDNDEVERMSTEYIVSFSKFIEGLNERGFEYHGTISFKEISEIILNDGVVPASIVADFRKKKNSQSLS